MAKRGKVRAENVLGSIQFWLTTLTATLFSSTSSSIATAYVSGDPDAFVDFLRRCHERQMPSKEAAGLFSPAIFDPNRVAGSNRPKRTSPISVTSCSIVRMGN